jgi:hypothetical protein
MTRRQRVAARIVRAAPVLLAVALTAPALAAGWATAAPSPAAAQVATGTVTPTPNPVPDQYIVTFKNHDPNAVVPTVSNLTSKDGGSGLSFSTCVVLAWT